MELRVLGAFGAEGLGQRPSTFLVNDRTLVDAGNVTGAIGPDDQRRVGCALISHAHLDHVAGLAFLAETLAVLGAPPVTIASIAPVVDGLRSSLFNDVLWPDFTRLPDPARPAVTFRTLVEGESQRVGDLHVTPIRVHHSVPSVGFIVHDGTRGFVYSGDTGPTEALWTAARRVPGIGAVILECAFPNRLTAVAEASGHMTPERIGRELEKVPDDVPVWIFHIKPQFLAETVDELSRVGRGRVSPIEQGRTYTI